MKITKDRFYELGLGCDKESCVYYQSGDCKGENDFEIAYGCIDEGRLQDDMTEEEYDAFRHNNLIIE